MLALPLHVHVYLPMMITASLENVLVGSASRAFANILLHYHWRHYQQNTAYSDTASCALRTKKTLSLVRNSVRACPTKAPTCGFLPKTCMSLLSDSNDVHNGARWMIFTMVRDEWYSQWCVMNDIHNGLRGSNDIHTASCATIAKMQVVIDLHDDRKSIGHFVRQ